MYTCICKKYKLLVFQRLQMSVSLTTVGFSKFFYRNLIIRPLNPQHCKGLYEYSHIYEAYIVVITFLLA